MLILLLVLLKSVVPQQELCYAGPGDVYSGFVNITARGESCENWRSQSLINTKLELDNDHNYCRVYQQLSSKPYCVVGGQKQSCNVPECDSSTLLFQGSSLLVTRNNMTLPLYPIVVQQIKFYFQVNATQRSQAVLVRVESLNDPRQYVSIVLQNGFLKLIVSLDSYNAEKYIFGGPISTGDVHYISVNRSRTDLFIRLNQTLTNQTLTNKDTTFLVSPYKIIVGENYNGCMTGLSIGTWILKDKKLTMFTDKPLNYYTGDQVGDFTVRFTKKGTPSRGMCMFAPTTTIQDLWRTQEVVEDDSVVEEAAVGTEPLPRSGKLDQTSIIIISTSLGIIFVLTLLTLICMKRNQNQYVPQGYNLEVM